MRYYSEMHTPIGPLTIVSDGTAITSISMRAASAVVRRDNGWTEDVARLASARDQLEAYFAGELTTFSMPLAASGTPFQQRVWAALSKIPFGTTTSYGALAASLGMAGSARAVGAANRTNPIGIVVPCHRVIGADGRLTGYAGGIERKKFLLEHEAAVIGAGRQEQLSL